MALAAHKIIRLQGPDSANSQKKYISIDISIEIILYTIYTTYTLFYIFDH